MSAGMSAFGTWLKERRRQLDLTQTELAERVGCSLEMVQKLERGSRRPSKQMVEALARQLKLSGDDSAQMMALARLGRATQEPSQDHAQIQTHTNLPRPITSFVGREHEISEVVALVGFNRLVTLTGPGGSGKTRLALAVGHEVAGNFPDGVYFADLAGITDSYLTDAGNPHLVPQTLGSALGLREQPGSDLIGTLQAYLDKRRVLVLLDNCEHVIEACASLADRLLKQCEGLHILATSRQPLGLSYEVTWSVPPLALPDPQVHPSSQDLTEFSAIQLLVQRARQRLPGFDVGEENAFSVLELCRRLDGMPLAIELAAARLHVLSIEQIVERLNVRFELLKAQGSDVPNRQRTLKDTIGWSYDLLTEPERTLFKALSVFPESFTLNAAHAIGMHDAPEHKAIALLTGLVEKSLLLALPEEHGQTRYRMLETIRHYGLEKLAGAGELAASRNRHLDYYLQFAQTGEPKLKGSEQLVWLNRFEREHENFRAALGWSLEEPSATDRGLELAVSLHWFWHVRSYLSEGRYWLESLLARTEYLGDSSLRAAGMDGVGVLAWLQYDIEAGLTVMKESMEIAERTHDSYRLAKAWSGMAMLTDFAGDIPAARMWNRRALAAFGELGALWDVAWALTGSGIMTMYAGDYGSAVVQFQENIEIYRQIGDEWATAIPMAYLGIALRHQGNYAEASRAFEQAMAIFRKFGDQRRVLWMVAYLGDVALAQHDLPRARAYYVDALTISSEFETSRFELIALRGAAYLARRGGDNATAARFLGAFSALNSDRQASSYVLGVPGWETAAQEYSGAWKEGEAMSMDQAITSALKALSEMPIESVS